MSRVQPTSSLGVVAARIFWMMLGPALLTISTILILRAGRGWFTPADLTFLILLSALLLARWVEFRSGDPRTMEGKQATPTHFRQYVLGTLLLGLGAWIVANVIANYWLTV